MTAEALELRHWSDRLMATIASCRNFNDVTVMQDVDSTQDAALRLKLEPGHILTASRQTRGRGRLGRRWIDDDATGTATTVVLAPTSGPHRSVAAAIAAARTVEVCIATDSTAGIRWPNDILIDGAKVAGILIEQDDTICRVGIGINVAAPRSERQLDQPITNLAQHGYRGDRCGVIEHLIREFDLALDQSESELAASWQPRDLLAGTERTFRKDDALLVGTVESVDPYRGIHIRVAADDASIMLDGDQWSMVHPPRSGGE